ncbi:MAG: hypothetical protein ABI656_04285, partial [bacterium]
MLFSPLVVQIFLMHINITVLMMFSLWIAAQIMLDSDQVNAVQRACWCYRCLSPLWTCGYDMSLILNYSDCHCFLEKKMPHMKQDFDSLVSR